MEAFLVLWRECRFQSLNLDAITALDLLHERVGFGKQKVGIQSEDAQLRLDLGRDVDEDHSFRAKSRGNFDVASEGHKSPAEQVFGSPLFDQLMNSIHS